MAGTLLITVEDPKEQEDLSTFSLGDKETIRIGRNERNDVVIKNPYISREHCSITRQGEVILLKNLSLSNGTIVNKIFIEDETIIKPGDCIELSDVRIYLGDKGIHQAKEFRAKAEKQPAGKNLGTLIRGDSQVQARLEEYSHTYGHRSFTMLFGRLQDDNIDNRPTILQAGSPIRKLRIHMQKNLLWLSLLFALVFVGVATFIAFYPFIKNSLF